MSKGTTIQTLSPRTSPGLGNMTALGNGASPPKYTAHPGKHADTLGAFPQSPPTWPLMELVLTHGSEPSRRAQGSPRFLRGARSNVFNLSCFDVTAPRPQRPYLTQVPWSSKLLVRSQVPRWEGGTSLLPPCSRPRTVAGGWSSATFFPPPVSSGPSQLPRWLSEATVQRAEQAVCTSD